MEGHTFLITVINNKDSKIKSFPCLHLSAISKPFPLLEKEFFIEIEMQCP